MKIYQDKKSKGIFVEPENRQFEAYKLNPQLQLIKLVAQPTPKNGVYLLPYIGGGTYYVAFIVNSEKVIKELTIGDTIPLEKLNSADNAKNIIKSNTTVIGQIDKMTIAQKQKIIELVDSNKIDEAQNIYKEHDPSAKFCCGNAKIRMIAAKFKRELHELE